MFKKIQQNLKVSKPNETNIIQSLYENPKKDKYKQIPSYKKGGAEPNQVYQADLLTMPNDKGYNYLLVCVDTITGLTDAVSLKTKEAEETLEGFKKMFAKGTPLTKPKWSIQLDEGGEFKSVVKKYFDDNGILVRYGKVDRSRQQTMAENRNKILAKALFQKQVGQEILTNKTSTNWVEDVQTVLDTINEYEKEQYEKRKQITAKRELKNPPTPYVPEDTTILEVGTPVRIKLDKPKGLLGEKLHGTFRATDIKWDPKIRKISNIILSPNQPVMYQVEGETTGFTRNQLQIVDENEKQPSQELLKKESAAVEAVTENIIKLAEARPLKKIVQTSPPVHLSKQKSTRGRVIKPNSKYKD